MSETQREIVAFIQQFTDTHGYSPSVRQICDGVDRGVATVNHHVAALVARGVLTHVPGQSRTVRVREADV